MRNYFRTLSNRFGAAWTQFWFTPSDPIVLSLMRLLVGLASIWWYLGYYADLQRWFGPNGLFPLDMTVAMRTDEGGTRHFAFSILDYVTSASELWFVYWIGLAVLVAMTLGILSRLTTIAGLVFVLSFIHRGPMLTRQSDDILPMLMFYLCIAPSGAYFSVDAWVRERRRRNSPNALAMPAVSQLSSAATVAGRMMQVHLALIYAAMAIAQLQAEPWWQGTAVWWLMARPDSRLVDLTGLQAMGQAFEYLVNLWTHFIVVYEVCFALLIWNLLARPILLVLGVVMWVGLALVGGSPSFAVLMLIANLAFLRPEMLRGCCAKWCGEKSVAVAA